MRLTGSLKFLNKKKLLKSNEKKLLATELNYLD